MKLADICNINHRSISKEDDFETIQYLDTSNLTENVIGDVQEIELSKAPRERRGRFPTKLFYIQLLDPIWGHP